MTGVNTMQIAKQLNLSRNTVSKALNNSPEVSDKTKQLVISTAAKLGYKRISKQDYETYAGNQTNYDICLMVHEREIQVGYWNIILQGVEEYLKLKKCKIVFGIISRIEEENELLPLAISSNDVSGIISVGSYTENYLRKIKETGIPMVSIDTASSVSDNRILSDTILTSNESSIYEITEKLIKNGCKDIAFAGDPYHCKSILERWKGYKSAMNDYNLAILPENEVFKNISVEHEFEKIAEIVNKIEKLPCAVVCANDIIANRLMRIFKSKGIKVPDDILISGFDNYDPAFSQSVRLTTVDYNIRELGYLAARQIIFRIERPMTSFTTIRTAATVIFNESTGAI